MQEFELENLPLLHCTVECLPPLPSASQHREVQWGHTVWAAVVGHTHQSHTLAKLHIWKYGMAAIQLEQQDRTLSQHAFSPTFLLLGCVSAFDYWLCCCESWKQWPPNSESKVTDLREWSTYTIVLQLQCPQLYPCVYRRHCCVDKTYHQLFIFG